MRVVEVDPSTAPHRALALIAAVARNRTIGDNQRLPWHLPEDLQHFRAITRDKTVLMGRRTWESLPARFRPLPQRRNIVLSRDPVFAAPGASVARSIAEALRLAAGDDVLVIGGADVYRQTLPLAQRLYLTEVAADYSGDACFPTLDQEEWDEVSRVRRTSAGGSPAFDFVVYERRRALG